MGGRARITDYTEGTKRNQFKFVAKTHIKLANQSGIKAA